MCDAVWDDDLSDAVQTRVDKGSLVGKDQSIAKLKLTTI